MSDRDTRETPGHTDADADARTERSRGVTEMGTTSRFEPASRPEGDGDIQPRASGGDRTSGTGADRTSGPGAGRSSPRTGSVDADDPEHTQPESTESPVETKGSFGTDVTVGDSSGEGSTQPRQGPAQEPTDGPIQGRQARTQEEEDGPGGLFDDLLDGEPIFENKEVLRPSYTPRQLPHREDQINAMATILVTALRGESPSNILIYGKTGTGKTASAKFVSDELESTSSRYEVPCEVQYINCEVTDTQYRVLAQLANTFQEENEAHIDDRIADLRALRERAMEDPGALADTQFGSVEAIDTEIDGLEADREGFEPVPMTGWPTDRVYTSFFEAVDYHERVVVIMLDEIDKLVEKSGDDTLYNLSRMNSDLENSRVSIMGISNDLKFTDFLDPRVKSSLGEEEIVFPPYDANQLRDILQHRADVAFKEGALSPDVIPLCAAFAAQEHGDARRALDLLRTAGELSERAQTDTVVEEHVRQAQDKIELDRVVEVVRTLPTQSKLVLFSTILLEQNGVHSINTGEVYNIYKRLCDEIDADILTQRRVTDLISELDMLGIVNAVVVSKGRYGRTKEISLSVPLEETEVVLRSDSRLSDIDDVQPFVQARFDN